MTYFPLFLNETSYHCYNMFDNVWTALLLISKNVCLIVYERLFRN